MLNGFATDLQRIVLLRNGPEFVGVDVAVDVRVEDLEDKVHLPLAHLAARLTNLLCERRRELGLADLPVVAVDVVGCRDDLVRAYDDCARGRGSRGSIGGARVCLWGLGHGRGVAVAGLRRCDRSNRG